MRSASLLLKIFTLLLGSSLFAGHYAYADTKPVNPRSINLPAVGYVAPAVGTLYIGEKTKITYIRVNQPAGLTQVKVYLDKDNPKPSHVHKIFLDTGMLDAMIYKDRLTLVLRHQKTDNLLVLEKDTGKVIDYFKTFNAAISPDGRFITYQHWTYRNEKSKYGTPAGTTLIYDVTKSAKDNRTLNHQKWLRRSRVTLARQSKNGGIPVYPYGDYNQPEYGWVEDAEKNVAVQSRYYWYGKDRFMFAATPWNGLTQLVDAVYNPETDKFDVTAYKLPTEGFMPEGESLEKLPTFDSIERVGDKVKLYSKSTIIHLPTLKPLKTMK